MVRPTISVMATHDVSMSPTVEEHPHLEDLGIEAKGVRKININRSRIRDRARLTMREDALAHEIVELLLYTEPMSSMQLSRFF